MLDLEKEVFVWLSSFRGRSAAWWHLFSHWQGFYRQPLSSIDFALLSFC